MYQESGVTQPSRTIFAEYSTVGVLTAAISELSWKFRIERLLSLLTRLLSSSSVPLGLFSLQGPPQLQQKTLQPLAAVVQHSHGCTREPSSQAHFTS